MRRERGCQVARPMQVRENREEGLQRGAGRTVVLFGEVRVFHRPHPSPNTDKGAVASIRHWLQQHGIVP